jgi:hypothetical protein
MDCSDIVVEAEGSVGVIGSADVARSGECSICSVVVLRVLVVELNNKYAIPPIRVIIISQNCGVFNFLTLFIWFYPVILS